MILSHMWDSLLPRSVQMLETGRSTPYDFPHSSFQEAKLKYGFREKRFFKAMISRTVLFLFAACLPAEVIFTTILDSLMQMT